MAAQKRGLERREHILRVARSMLKEKDLAELTLADVAKHAEVPVSSIYHFYPSILDVYRGLVEQFRDELTHFLERRFRSASAGEIRSWQQLVDWLIDGCAQFYKDNYEFQQLILSGKAPAHVKQLDRENDYLLAKLISKTFGEFFQLPAIPNLENIVFNSVEMVDMFFSLSVYRHNNVTEAGIEETKRAVVSYLRCYFPEYLGAWRDLSTI